MGERRQEQFNLHLGVPDCLRSEDLGTIFRHDQNCYDMSQSVAILKSLYFVLPYQMFCVHSAFSDKLVRKYRSQQTEILQIKLKVMPLCLRGNLEVENRMHRSISCSTLGSQYVYVLLMVTENTSSYKRLRSQKGTGHDIQDCAILNTEKPNQLHPIYNSLCHLPCSFCSYRLCHSQEVILEIA